MTMKFILALLLCLLGSLHIVVGNEQSEWVEAMAARQMLEVALTATFTDNLHGVLVTTLQAESASRPVDLLDGDAWTDYCFRVQIDMDFEPFEKYSDQLPHVFRSFRVFYHVGKLEVVVSSEESSSAKEGEMTFCPALMEQCADGSWSSLSGPHCKPTCPEDKPTGRLTFEQVETVAHHFYKKYPNEPLALYINQLQYEKIDGELTANETSQDYCVDLVFLSQTSDIDIPTPAVFEGVRFFYMRSTDWCPSSSTIRTCKDGSVALLSPNCVQVCPEDRNRYMGVFGTSIVAMLVLISLISCCMLRTRRCKRNGFQPLPAAPVADEEQMEEASNMYPGHFAPQEEPSAPPMMMMMPPPYPMGMMPPPHMASNPYFVPPPNYPGHPMFMPHGYPMMMMPPPFPAQPQAGEADQQTQE